MNQNTQNPQQTSYPTSPVQPPIQGAPTNTAKGSKRPSRQVIILYVLLGLVTIGSIVGLTAMYINTRNLEQRTLQAEDNARKYQTARDVMYEYWDKQIRLNDDLVDKQNIALKDLVDYQSELKTNFRFINGQPQGNPGQDINKLIVAEDRVYKVLTDIDRLIEENAKKKEESTKAVDSLYKRLGEEPKPIVNPN
jgi:hypothetical protein